MTPEELVRAGSVTLVFDAPNVPVKKLFALAKAAKSYGVALRLLVPVTAHTEKVTHLRQKRGARYDAQTVRRALEDAGVEILPLDTEAAESLAERLCQWFPEDAAWQDAKWKRLHGSSPRSPNRRVSATIDWYTAALCPQGAVVVTDDTGPEFRECVIIRSGALEQILKELEPTPSPAAP